MEVSSDPIISIIVAKAVNGVIGINNRLPWRLSGDLRHFKQITIGKPLIMGRKTFDSIGKPLPGRDTVVITRDDEWHVEGVRRVSSFDDALNLAGSLTKGLEEIIVAGGAEIYRQALPVTRRIYLTEVKAAPAGDTYFPQLPGDWVEVSRDSFPQSDKDEFSYDIVMLQRS